MQDVSGSTKKVEIKKKKVKMYIETHISKVRHYKTTLQEEI